MPLPSYLFKVSSTGNDLLSPDSGDTGSELISREEGGIAVSNPSAGLRGYNWHSIYTPSTGTIILKNDTTSVEYTILSGVMLVDSLSFAFDSNMRPLICYTITTGEAYYYWYDSVTEGFLTTQLPAGSITPKACHDDKRAAATTNNRSDAMFFYMLNGVVYHRVQRERYLTDHRIATCTSNARLKNVGMTVGLRIKLHITEGQFISSP